MTTAKAISLFLIDGTPTGRIACELYNWTGKAYRIPRTLLKSSTTRADLYRTGVYFLFGRDGEDEQPTAYIGEAEEVFKRLLQHQSIEFWNEVLVFVSKDENLNKAHAKFLENNCHSAAKDAGRYKIANGNVPNCPAISEAEQAVMLEFFENLKLLTGTLGYKMFEPLRKVEPERERTLTVHGARGAEARAMVTNEGLVVLKGSKAAATLVPSAGQWINDLRQRLQENGVLVQQDGVLIFSRDHLFGSPSAAAALVLGRSANGRAEWKDSRRRTLAEIEEA